MTSHDEAEMREVLAKVFKAVGDPGGAAWAQHGEAQNVLLIAALDELRTYADSIAARVRRETLEEAGAVRDEEGNLWTAAKLKALLADRDDFLARKGLFSEYAAQAGRSLSPQAGEKKDGGSVIFGGAGHVRLAWREERHD